MSTPKSSAARDCSMSAAPRDAAVPSTQSECATRYTDSAWKPLKNSIGCSSPSAAGSTTRTFTRSETTARRTSGVAYTRSMVERSASSAVATSARVPLTLEYAKDPGSGGCTLLESSEAIDSASELCLRTHDCTRLAVIQEPVSSPASRLRLQNTARSHSSTSASDDSSKSNVLSRLSSSAIAAAPLMVASAELQSVSSGPRGCARATAQVRISPALLGSKFPSGN
mmetsp:Transcript_31015/g.81115  ORF Transcript_31015/g.81115 Transcript_31015/m.81115 type:complete len:226 (-) Transcript_31015:14-691(-)